MGASLMEASQKQCLPSVQTCPAGKNSWQVAGWGSQGRACLSKSTLSLSLSLFSLLHSEEHWHLYHPSWGSCPLFCCSCFQWHTKASGSKLAPSSPV